jgi:hypothetical protein
MKLMKKKDIDTSKRTIRINRSSSNIFKKEKEELSRQNGQSSVSPAKLNGM